MLMGVKRTSVIVCLLLVSSLLRAQVTLSVDLGYSNKGYSYQMQGIPAYNGLLPSGQACYFAPRVGYTFRGEVGIGMQLGVGYSSYDYVDGYYDPEAHGWQQSALTNSSLLAATAKAYMRLRFAEVGAFSFHVELSASYSHGWGTDSRMEYRASDAWKVEMVRRQRLQFLSAQAVPVINYAFGKHVSADLYLNLAALTFSSTTTALWPYGIKNVATTEEPETETTTQEFVVGINALNTNVLTIGFNYTFN